MATKKTTKKAPAKKTAAAKKSTDPELTTPPDQPNAEGALQHPSLADTPKPGVEVAERSQDVDKGSTETHRKTYVLLKSAYEQNTTSKAGRDELHRANIEAARQAMMSQGLRPTGDGKFAGSEEHPDKKSIFLHYDVPAVPAVVALAETGEETVTHAHVTLDDQHAAEDEAGEG